MRHHLFVPDIVGLSPTSMLYPIFTSAIPWPPRGSDGFRKVSVYPLKPPEKCQLPLLQAGIFKISASLCILCCACFSLPQVADPLKRHLNSIFLLSKFEQVKSSTVVPSIKSSYVTAAELHRKKPPTSVLKRLHQTSDLHQVPLFRWIQVIQNQAFHPLIAVFPSDSVQHPSDRRPVLVLLVWY